MSKIAVILLAALPGEEQPIAAWVVLDNAVPDTDPARPQEREGQAHYILDANAANSLLAVWESMAPNRGYIPGESDAGWSWFLATLPGGERGSRIFHDEWAAITDAEGNRLSQWSTYDLSQFNASFVTLTEDQFESAGIPL